MQATPASVNHEHVNHLIEQRILRAVLARHPR
jgi:hypothetical protein